MRRIPVKIPEPSWGTSYDSRGFESKQSQHDYAFLKRQATYFKKMFGWIIIDRVKGIILSLSPQEWTISTIQKPSNKGFTVWIYIYIIYLGFFLKMDAVQSSRLPPLIGSLYDSVVSTIGTCPLKSSFGRPQHQFSTPGGLGRSALEVPPESSIGLHWGLWGGFESLWINVDDGHCVHPVISGSEERFGSAPLRHDDVHK